MKRTSDILIAILSILVLIVGFIYNFNFVLKDISKAIAINGSTNHYANLFYPALYCAAVVLPYVVIFFITMLFMKKRKIWSVMNLICTLIVVGFIFYSFNSNQLYSEWF